MSGRKLRMQPYYTRVEPGQMNCKTKVFPFRTKKLMLGDYFYAREPQLCSLSIRHFSLYILRPNST